MGEERIGRIHSVDLKTKQNIHPILCKARQIKVVSKPIRMNVSSCRAAKGEPTPTLKVQFKDDMGYYDGNLIDECSLGKKCLVQGVHHVGREVTLTGFYSPILLSPQLIA